MSDPQIAIQLHYIADAIAGLAKAMGSIGLYMWVFILFYIFNDHGGEKIADAIDRLSKKFRGKYGFD